MARWLQPAGSPGQPDQRRFVLFQKGDPPLSSLPQSVAQERLEIGNCINLMDGLLEIVRQAAERDGGAVPGVISLVAWGVLSFFIRPARRLSGSGGCRVPFAGSLHAVVENHVARARLSPSRGWPTEPTLTISFPSPSVYSLSISSGAKNWNDSVKMPGT